MKTSTRALIIERADELFYQQGFDHTSFAHIAKDVNISRGNFYHHFKSKDEILDAVIDFRLSKTQTMLDEWDQEGDTPEARIRCFIHILIRNMSKIVMYGCPVGTLTSELAKLDHASLNKAGAVFSLFREWLARQFDALGFSDRSDALAMHVLARSQGIATLASAFKDETFINEEVATLNLWLEQQLASR